MARDVATMKIAAHTATSVPTSHARHRPIRGESTGCIALTSVPAAVRLAHAYTHAPITTMTTAANSASARTAPVSTRTEPDVPGTRASHPRHVADHNLDEPRRKQEARGGRSEHGHRELPAGVRRELSRSGANRQANRGLTAALDELR